MGEGVFVFREGECDGDGINLRLGEDAGGGDLEICIVDAGDVVAVDYAQGSDAGQRERGAEVVQEVAGLGGKGGEFFDDESVLFQNLKL